MEDICSVHPCRLVELPVNPHNGGQIDHHSVADPFPEIKCDNQKGPVSRRVVKINPLTSQGSDNIVDQTIVILKQVIHQNPQQYKGHEVGHEHQSLGDLFKPLSRSLAHQDCKEYLQHISQKNKSDIVQYGVFRKPEKISLHQKFKVFHSHKGACPQSVPEIKAGKGIVDSNHGQITVDQEVDKHGNQHEEQDPVFPYFLHKAVFMIKLPLLFLHHLDHSVGGCGQYCQKINDGRCRKSFPAKAVIGKSHKSQTGPRKQQGEAHGQPPAGIQVQISVFPLLITDHLP